MKKEEIELLIAKDLLDIKAVFFRPDEPFTWASGIKSPVYTDNRLTLTAPKVRDDIENAFADIIKENFKDVEALVGTATAGIAHTAITAHILNLPMGYVRSKAKDHGRGNQIEGKITKGMKVVVVEDLVSTGGSSFETITALRENGVIVLGIVSIFTYNMKKSIECFKNGNVEHISLTNFDVITKVAAKENYIKQEDIKKLLAFRDNPSDESWIKG